MFSGFFICLFEIEENGNRVVFFYKAFLIHISRRTRFSIVHSLFRNPLLILVIKPLISKYQFSHLSTILSLVLHLQLGKVMGRKIFWSDLSLSDFGTGTAVVVSNYWGVYL